MMNWKEIESYIDTNRNQIDVEEPRKELWKELENNLDRPRLLAGIGPMLQFPVWKVAATLLFAVGVVVLFLKFMPIDTMQNMAGSIHTESIYQFSDKEFQDLKQANELLKQEILRYEDSLKEVSLAAYDFAEEYMDELSIKKKERESLEKVYQKNPKDEHHLFTLVEAHKNEVAIWKEFFERIEAQ